MFAFLLFVFLFTSPLAVQGESPIKNVVVLMLENRAFDHMVGYLKQSLNPEIDGLFGNESNPIDPQGFSKEVYVSNDASYVEFCPAHEINDATEQIFGSSTPSDVATMNGFVASALKVTKKGESVMECFNSVSVPVISTLAEEFAIYDRWYSSVPGPTDVNRMYVHSATSHGMGKNQLSVLVGGAPQTTIFNNMHAQNITWKVYMEEVSTVLFFKRVRAEKFLLDNFVRFDDFLKDSAKGTLPQYSFIEPSYFNLPDDPANDQHPSNDVVQGELLMKTVYESLRASPQWNQTLFIITYDEHGGFYDHVPTPLVNVPNPDGINSTDPPFDFQRLGVRVPMVMISPWIEKGTVVHEPLRNHYEHSSIPATLKKLFNLTSFLTERDAWSATFEDIYSQRSTPRTDCPLTLPSPPPINSHRREVKNRPPSDLQMYFMELAGSLTGDLSWKAIDNEFEAAVYCKEQFYHYLGWKDDVELN